MPLINRTGGGGSQIPLNLFVQPELPTDKFDGICILAPEKHNVSRITDKNSFTIGGAIRTYDSSLNVTHYSNQDNQRIVIVSYNNDIYQISGYASAADLTLAIHKWDHSTNTMSTVYSHDITLSVSSLSAVIACISGTTLYAAVSCYDQGVAGTIICNFDLETQTGTTTEDTSHDLLRYWTPTAYETLYPSGQIGYKDNEVYYIYRVYNNASSSPYSTYKVSFDFSTNSLTYHGYIVGGTSQAAGWKQLAEGVLVDDKIYYQCFADSSDTSISEIRIYDITTGTETTQSLGYNLKPSIYGIAAYQNKLYLHCTDSDTALHEFEIGVWTNRTISTFAIMITAVIQIGTSLAVLGSPDHIQYYDFVSETLAENTLAILDGISRNTELISTSKMNVPFRFQDAWWYSTDFHEYPTYIGNGTEWTKYKN